MSEATIWSVLREFDMDSCEAEGGACDNEECVGARMMANTILDLRDALTDVTQRAEAAEAKSRDVAYWHEAWKASEAERDALRKDAERLDWLADTVAIEGFGIDDVDAAAGSIGMDIYEHASIVADERGNDDDPTVSDQREGFRRMIDAALAVQP